MRYLLLLLLVQPALAQSVDLDAPCLIYKAEQDSRSDWCGVAISRTEILSCGHHRQTGDVRVEFPLGRYGSTEAVPTSDCGQTGPEERPVIDSI
jgi:hypothetical protein